MRVRLGILALGCVGSWTMARLPLPPGDPFRSTLVWLPLLAAGFVLLDRWPGGRRIRSRTRAFHATALLLLVGAVWSRELLAVRYSDVLVDRALAVALAALLAHRVLAHLVALRSRLGRVLPATPSVAFFLLPCLVYLAILPWASERRQPDGDEPFYLLVAHSLAFDLDLDLANNYEAEDYLAFVDRPLEPQPGDPVGGSGEVYSRHNALLPLVLAPGYRALGPRGALATMALVTALLSWCTLRLARHYLPRSPREALLAWATLSFTAPILLFSHQAWVEIPAALLTVLALDAILATHGPLGFRTPRVVPALLGIVLLPLLKLRFLLIAGPLALLAAGRLGRRRTRRAVLWTAVGLAGFLGAILLTNAVMFGNPLKYHRFAQVGAYTESLSAYLLGGSGLWLDCGFGLAAAAPIWLLLCPALLRPELRVRRIWVHIGLLVGPYLLVLAPRGEWYGAWSPPFRYGVVGLPLLCLALGRCLTYRRRGLGGLALQTLAWLTLAVTLLWVALPEWTYNLAHGRSHLLDALGGYFQIDFARFFPSSLRPRTATWAWPLAIFVLSLVPWRRPNRGPRVRAAAAVAAALALTLSGFLAAVRLPPRILEAEDPWLTHSGGVLYPEQWVLSRRRYRGGWSLPARSQLGANFRNGSDSVTLAVSARKLTPKVPAGALAVELDGVTVARILLPDRRGWQELEVGPFSVRPGERTEFKLISESVPGAQSGTLVDCVRFRWN